VVSRLSEVDRSNPLIVRQRQERNHILSLWGVQAVNQLVDFCKDQFPASLIQSRPSRSPFLLHNHATYTETAGLPTVVLPKGRPVLRGDDRDGNTAQITDSYCLELRVYLCAGVESNPARYGPRAQDRGQQERVHSMGQDVDDAFHGKRSEPQGGRDQPALARDKPAEDYATVACNITRFRRA